MENGALKDYLKAHPEADRARLVRKIDLTFVCTCPNFPPQLYETAEALAYLHRRGIIHGNIKAANILVSNALHALLCDFGLTELAIPSAPIALSGVRTLDWEAPELSRYNSAKTYQSDTYAFGMTIAEVRDLRPRNRIHSDFFFRCSQVNFPWLTAMGHSIISWLR